MRRHLPLLAVLVSAVPVMAHPAPFHDMTAQSAAWAGFLHPLTGLDHLLVMLAVGLWAVRLGGRAMWMLPCAFVLPMILGGGAGIGTLSMPAIEHGMAASLLLLGASLCMAWKPSLPVALSFVALCGTCHGFAHGSEIPAGATPLLFLAGMATTTSLLHAAGVAAGVCWEGRRLEYAFRIAGLILITSSAVIAVAA